LVHREQIVQSSTRLPEVFAVHRIAVAGAGLDGLEYGPEHLESASSVKSHPADLGFASKHDKQQHLIGNLNNMKIGLTSLVKENGEFALVENLSKLARGCVRTRGEDRWSK
jgi:hypothetical protein